MSDAGALPYRPCAVMLANRTGRIFVGQRIDSSADAWQMPQGGIDPGEDAEAASCASSRRKRASTRGWSTSSRAAGPSISTTFPTI